MNLHILSDPVSDFWKCPKKGILKKLFMVYFWFWILPPDMHHHCTDVTHEGWEPGAVSWPSRNLVTTVRYEDDFLID